jgi:polar amino acid transport system substrate-binding protein
MVTVIYPHRFLPRLNALLLTAFLAASSCLAQTAKLSLTSGGAPPLTATPNHPGFLDELAKAMFKRIGVEVEVTAVPTERSLINVNSGIDDGDLFRVAGVEAEYPNVIRVPEKIMDNDFVAYTKRGDIRIRGWTDLQPYSVAYTTGWKIYDRNVKGVRDIVTTPSINGLPALLEKNRVDVILMDRWQGQWALQQGGHQFMLQEPPLASVQIFTYLNKKHAALVPRLARALKDMKADGSYQKIYDATLNRAATR